MSNEHTENSRPPRERSDRTQIIMEATYFAAVYGWFDTSEAAQKASLLTVDMMDMVNAGVASLPEGATHKFFICVDNTSCIVTRYEGGHYEVQEYDRVELHRQERALRKAVMDTALAYFTGHSPDPRPEAQEEARNEVIQALLEGIEPDQERDGGPVIHAVVRDSLLPGIFSIGDEAKMRVLRQWTVNIGHLACEVGLLRYNPNGPELIARDVREANEADEGEEAGVHVGKDRIAVIKALYPDAQGEELIERLKAFQAILNDPAKMAERHEAYLANQREEPEQQ